MSVTLQHVPLSGAPICDAVIHDYAKVDRFYIAGQAEDRASYKAAIDFIRVAQPDSHWEALGELSELAGPGAAERLETVIRGRGVFVATGQQAGLFGGPLLTVYKALTAARLADQLEADLGVPVMPLFTVASEDHDWREINHAHVIDLENRLVRISVGDVEEEVASTPHPAVWRIPIESGIETVLEQLSESTPDTDLKADILEVVREWYRPGNSYVDAFAQLMRYLMRQHRFLVVPGSHPSVKRRSRDLLRAEWDARRESERRLRRRSEELEEAGFAPQVPVPAGATNLFLEGKLGRDRVLYEEGGARLRRSAERLTEDELRRILEEETERVSPGALLRPVAEACVFPVVAHVVGPSEIAYLAESQVLYSLHEVPAPVVVPRVSLRIVEPKIGRILDKYGISADELAGDAAQAINRLLKELAPPELKATLERLRRAVTEALADVEAAALAFDAGAKSAVGSGKKSILASIEGLEAKLEARVKEKHGVQKRQLEKAALHLYPNGQPQERILNVLPYLIRYGTSLLEEMYAGTVTPLD